MLLSAMVSAERYDTHCVCRAVPAWSACWSRLYTVPAVCDAYLSQRAGLCVALSKQLEKAGREGGLPNMRTSRDRLRAPIEESVPCIEIASVLL